MPWARIELLHALLYGLPWARIELLYAVLDGQAGGGGRAAEAAEGPEAWARIGPRKSWWGRRTHSAIGWVVEGRGAEWNRRGGGAVELKTSDQSHTAEHNFWARVGGYVYLFNVYVYVYYMYMYMYMCMCMCMCMCMYMYMYVYMYVHLYR